MFNGLGMRILPSIHIHRHISEKISTKNDVDESSMSPSSMSHARDIREDINQERPEHAASCYGCNSVSGNAISEVDVKTRSG